MAKKAATQTVVEELRKPATAKKVLTYESKDLLSSGCDVLNLACSGKVQGAFSKGSYTLMVGDSSSGKSFLVLTALAEASINPEFAKYDLIYDGPEQGAKMDLRSFFGSKAASRIRPPKGTAKDPIPSKYVEDFYANVKTCLDADKPFIYLLDSMDALEAREDEKKADKQAKALEKGNDDVAGSYGTAKAKLNSGNLRKIIPRLVEHGSILIIIGQTRDNIGNGYEKKTRSGGKALKFYADLEMWTAIQSKITKNVKEVPLKIGINAEVAIKKNRQCGQERKVSVCLVDEIGIDNTRTSIDFLLHWGHWKSNKQGFIEATEWDISLRKEALIRKVESENLERDLRGIVVQVWQEIEEALHADRKRKYE